MGNRLILGTYYPKIDSVRAIAVLFVLFQHYFPEKVTSVLGLGNFGVDIFFTLSGFLITGILISYRSIRPIGAAIRKFYFRRILRIFPIYYLYILIVVLVFRSEISKTFIAWAAFYGINFYTINYGGSKIYLSHFWSLAVEEQFYLIWPFLILIFPFKYLRTLMIGTVIFSISFSYLYLHKSFVAYMHPFSCMQALAIGALVKYLTEFNIEIFKDIGKRLNQFFLLFLALWICVLLVYDAGNLYAFPLLRTFAALITAVILFHIVLKSGSEKFNKILDSKALQFIGRISYGIYVYQFLVKILLDPIVQQTVNRLTKEHSLIRYNIYIFTAPLYTAITISVAWLSFKYIESPINRLKNRNNFATKPTATTSRI